MSNSTAETTITSAPENVRVHVISLDRTPERFAGFIATNKMDGASFSRIRAVDGQELDRARLVSEGIIADDLVFTDNSVACALSHMQAWKIAVDELKAVTVCEDDAVIHPEFGRVHYDLVGSLLSADIIYWGYNLDMHIACEVPGFGICTMIYESDYFATEEGIKAFQKRTCSAMIYKAIRLYGALCYTITPSGAEKLLRYCAPLNNVWGNFYMATGLGKPLRVDYESCGIDVHAGIAALPNIIGYALVPPLVISPNDKTNSTIGKGWRANEQSVLMNMVAQPQP